ncbi:MAG TPA: hypothetical protein PLN52_02835 [Opitutaceae bacterium]|nr:hypothetical protein [Opitutaceae bacterium]
MSISLRHPALLGGLIVALGLLGPSGNLLAQSSANTTVPGLSRDGMTTKVVNVSVVDKKGRFRSEATPGIAVVQSARWSPNDAERDGASEFEIYLSVARLLAQHPLAGVIGVGNQNGSFLPAAEVAFTRTAAMGVPVVKVASPGKLTADPSNLYIEAGQLSPEDARAALSECLLTLGTLPPAADPLNPTEQELTAIRTKIARFQLIFDAKANAMTVAVR